MTHSGRAARAPRQILALLLLLALATPATAIDLVWPEGAQRVTGDARATSSFRIATGGFDGTRVPTIPLEGRLAEEVWQIPGEAGATEILLATLRAQLEAQGYAIGFVCADLACGGFDFRFALPIAEGPEMHVDLGEFRYLTATRMTGAGPDTVALTVSHGGQQGYVHLVQVAPADALPAPVTPSTRTVTAPRMAAGAEAGVGLISALLETGSGTLDDLNFETGASALTSGDFESLMTLAAFLAENTARRVVLVGHTDAEGSLAANIELSEARASAVRRYLIDALGTDPAQVEAAGIGFLAPRAANTSDAGRAANRRVEVVVLTRE